MVMHAQQGGMFPCTCTCMQGRPIYIQLVGKINMSSIMAVSNEERLFKFHVQVSWRLYGRAGAVSRAGFRRRAVQSPPPALHQGGEGGRSRGQAARGIMGGRGPRCPEGFLPWDRCMRA